MKTQRYKIKLMLGSTWNGHLFVQNDKIRISFSIMNTLIIMFNVYLKSSFMTCKFFSFLCFTNTKYAFLLHFF
jgi:hypothetical protein